LETHTMYVPKLKSHVLKIMSLKIPCLSFGEPPPLQANSRWPKTETIKNAMFSVFKWVISGERAVTGRIFQALPTQTDTVALIYRIRLMVEDNNYIMHKTTQ
jgi:hypothetical protein